MDPYYHSPMGTKSPPPPDVLISFVREKPKRCAFPSLRGLGEGTIVWPRVANVLTCFGYDHYPSIFMCTAIKTLLIMFFSWLCNLFDLFRPISECAFYADFVFLFLWPTLSMPQLLLQGVDRRILASFSGSVLRSRAGSVGNKNAIYYAKLIHKSISYSCSSVASPNIKHSAHF